MYSKENGVEQDVRCFFGAPLKAFKPNMSLLCAVLVVLRVWEGDVALFLPLSSFSPLSLLIVPSFFKAVMSPSVLDSNV